MDVDERLTTTTTTTNVCACVSVRRDGIGPNVRARPCAASARYAVSIAKTSIRIGTGIGVRIVDRIDSIDRIDRVVRACVEARVWTT